jgi:hypothetical protein
MPGGACKTTYQPVTYNGAGEAPDATADNKKARDTAWKRWKELLKKL